MGARTIAKRRVTGKPTAPGPRPGLPARSAARSAVPLAHGLVEQHAGGDRDIEALDGAERGQPDHHIAVLTGELTQARPFGAHDEGDRTREDG